jgi:membrane protein YqaA with SNARE-associated domain
LGSEAVLLYDVEQGYSLFWLLTTATIGNTLGAVVNYVLGYQGEKFLEKKKLIKKEKFSTFKTYFQKYGAWTLLLSWLPLVGDLFTLVAGVARYSFWRFFVLVFLAKGGRYGLLVFGWNCF